MFNFMSLCFKMMLVNVRSQTEQVGILVKMLKCLSHRCSHLTSIPILAMTAIIVSGCATDVTMNLKPTNAARDCTSGDDAAVSALFDPLWFADDGYLLFRRTWQLFEKLSGPNSTPRCRLVR